jgi:hypothetical protein
VRGLFDALTLGSQDPSNSPTGQTKALGETIDDQNIIFVDVIHVLSR